MRAHQLSPPRQESCLDIPFDPGYGIDVRPRKIWSLYGDEIDLRVESLTPGPDTLFPEADWLLGNHSDEVWVSGGRVAPGS